MVLDFNQSYITVISHCQYKTFMQIWIFHCFMLQMLMLKTLHKTCSLAVHYFAWIWLYYISWIIPQNVINLILYLINNSTKCYIYHSICQVKILHDSLNNSILRIRHYFRRLSILTTFFRQMSILWTRISERNKRMVKFTSFRKAHPL